MLVSDLPLADAEAATALAGLWQAAALMFSSEPSDA